MKGLISCSVACRFYDIPTGKCKLKCEEKADPNADFYDDCPMPDVVKVKHGYWDDGLDGITPYCSVCGHSHGCIKRTPNYCPNCGAKMDGGENDGN